MKCRRQQSFPGDRQRKHPRPAKTLGIAARALESSQPRLGLSVVLQCHVEYLFHPCVLACVATEHAGLRFPLLADIHVELGLKADRGKRIIVPDLMEVPARRITRVNQWDRGHHVGVPDDLSGAAVVGMVVAILVRTENHVRPELASTLADRASDPYTMARQLVITALRKEYSNELA